MNNDRRELSGWKEIARHLGVSEKAAVNYERHLGMPVHRIPGPKGRVWAFTNEVDAWKLQRPPAMGTPSASVPRGRNHAYAVKRIRLASLTSIFAIIAMLSIVAGLWAARHIYLKPRPVVSLRFSAATLTAVDRQGRVVWEYQFPKPYLTPEAENLAKAIAIFDLDGDGLPEVLFRYTPAPQHGEVSGMELYCFSRDGKVLWRFVPGRVVSDGSEKLLPPYFISTVQVIPARNSEGPWIAVSSNHYLSHPNQVAILDRNGSLVGEYWHSGHLTAMGHADLDGDGIEELLLGGVDNGIAQATLLVFDPRFVSGANHYSGRNPYQLQGFTAGSEKVEITFPRSDFNVRERFNQIFSIQTLPNRILVPVTESRWRQNGNVIFYEFDRSLNIVSMEKSPEVVMTYRELHQQGLVNHDWSDTELERLKGDVSIVRHKLAAR